MLTKSMLKVIRVRLSQALNSFMCAFFVSFAIQT